MAKAKKNQKPAKEQAVERMEKNARIIAWLCVVLMFITTSYWQTRNWMMDPATLPIKVVRIDGSLKYLQIGNLESAVASVVSGGFFNIDLERIRAAAEKLAWVESASVKRIWPDTVVMTVQEKQALARWGKRALVTAAGDVFIPPAGFPENLPGLSGPDSRAAEVIERFAIETQRFNKHGLKVSGLDLNSRGAWSISFGNGLKVAVGRTSINTRLRRLDKYLSTLKQAKGMPVNIDLRYRYGMAVTWKQTPAKAGKQKGAV